MFINRSAHFGISPLIIVKVSELMNAFYGRFFIYTSKLKSLTLLCFSCSLIPSSGFLLAFFSILCLFMYIFILEYLM